MEDKVEFEVLEAKLLGSDTVVYKLEDKTEIKIRVDIARVGVAKNFEKIPMARLVIPWIQICRFLLFLPPRNSTF